MNRVSDHMESVQETFDTFRAIHGDECGYLLSSIATLAATGLLAAGHMRTIALLAKEQGALSDELMASIDRIHQGCQDSITKGISSAILSSASLSLAEPKSPSQAIGFRDAAFTQVQRSLDRVSHAACSAEPDQD